MMASRLMEHPLIDLRSDTVTLPSVEMLDAIVHAKLGDDQLDGDPTTRELEALAAATLGKAAGVLLPSTTMGNLVAILAHTRPGDEVIVDLDSHLFRAEAAGIAAIAGCQTRPLSSGTMIMSPDDVADAIRSPSLHQPRTGLICVENTENRLGGVVIPVERMDDIASVAATRDAPVPIHVDGARIFNAATALGVDVARLVKGADSVVFSLDKGLSAPSGAVLVGGDAFIARARQMRQRIGGAMRQSGVIAAAGIVAITVMATRLGQDHAHARQLARELAAVPGLRVDEAQVQTNIVLIEVDEGRSADTVAQELAQEGVLAGVLSNRKLRLVTHRHVGPAEVERTVQSFRVVLASQDSRHSSSSPDRT
jgi:threonine aldolase